MALQRGCWFIISRCVVIITLAFGPVSVSAVAAPVGLREAGAHWAKRLLVPRLHYFSALPLQIGASLSSNLGTNKEALELSSSSL